MALAMVAGFLLLAGGVKLAFQRHTRVRGVLMMAEIYASKGDADKANASLAKLRNGAAADDTDAAVTLVNAVAVEGSNATAPLIDESARDDEERECECCWR